MRACLACVLLLALSAPARADETPVAIGVNLPAAWVVTKGVAVSGYAGVTKHFAVRANLATYANTIDTAAGLTMALLRADQEDHYEGRVYDVGAAWMYFPRRLWKGASLEAGLLWRYRDVRRWNEEVIPQLVETRTATYGGRVLAGRSWMIGSHVFISFAGGLSVGYEIGRETIGRLDPMEGQMTTDVGRIRVSSELFLRVGGIFSI